MHARNPLYRRGGSSDERAGMRILFVTDHLTQASGGVARILAETASHVAGLGVDVEVWCVGSADMVFAPGVRVRAFPGGKVGRWSRSPSLGDALRSATELAGFDLLHVFGVWGYPQLKAVRAARRVGLPCVVSDYGMLLPWFWDYKGRLQRIKKWAYWNGMFRRALPPTAVWHSATPAAAAEVARLLPNITVVTLAPGCAAITAEGQYTNSSPEQTIMFLGRLDPQKGIDILIEGFQAADLPQQWKLELVGPEFTRVSGYAEGLRSLVRDLGLDGRVTFAGPLFGKEKHDRLRAAWCLFAPSRAESPGMVSIEAAACGLPVVLSATAGLEGWESTGGMVIEPQVLAVRDALIATTAWTIEERRERGRRSQSVVRDRYSWGVLGGRWLELYQAVVSRDLNNLDLNTTVLPSPRTQVGF